MATQVTNYQCPNCGGPLRFSSEKQVLVCDYCGSEFTPKQVEDFYAEKDAAASQALNELEQQLDANPEEIKTEWEYSGSEWSENMRVYSCPSCGAQIMCDENTAATSCPYCGNPSIVAGNFSGGFKPDYCIPFKLDKDAAVRALKDYYKGKIFLPKAFTDENHIEEIKGVYVPFWLYDGDVDADVSYYATRSRSWMEGDYRVTRTDHYKLIRNGSVSFVRIPVDGSSKMPDDHMDAIEPFDYSELKPFSTAYMPGYLADKYDVDSKQSLPRATGRAQRSSLSAMTATTGGYDGVSVASSRFRLSNGRVRYAFLPVWVLSTKWKDQNYLFTMNGQTGKLIGNLPVSAGKFIGTFLGIAAAIFAVGYAVLTFM
ncbi:MAG: hypothetical protein IIU19_03355 [Oscillospiraceae bacterium]|nr:hypothetical protein [Oscillospiraceae bacterium]